MRILVVDDDYDMVETVKLFLDAQGFEVTTAYDGETGVASAARAAPDLCLLDLVLPDMDGRELTKAIRGVTGCARTRVVLLTAMGGRKAVEAYLGDGENSADAYVEKPVNFKELKSLIEKLLDTR
ncbi:MAG: response regulator [Deltaproteobacteria bacterium]|nr:response regulator [Deltaproteobacteria bacterium]